MTVIAAALRPKPSSDETSVKSATNNHTSGRVGSMAGRRWCASTVRVSASSAKLAMLKMSFTGACRRIMPSAIAPPITRARTSSPGETRKTPTTSGISLSE